MASDTIVHSNDVQKGTDLLIYTKLKEIIVYKNLSKLRVSWEFERAWAEGQVYSRLYINGVAVGVEHYTSTMYFVEVYDDIENVKVEDLIQIYGYAVSDGTVNVQNMKIKFDEFVNNDP